MKKIVVTGISAAAVVLLLGIMLKTKPANETPARTGIDKIKHLAADTPGNQVAGEQSVHLTDRTNKTNNALSAPVKALLGLDEKEHNYATLLSLIRTLSKDLSTADTVALMDMLTWPNDRFPRKMRPIEINAIKNDVMDRLLRQHELPEGLGLQLVEMASNPDNDIVWRDYCVQFMQPFYERVSAEGVEQGAGSTGGSQASATAGSEAAAPPPEPAIVREAMFAALDERGSTIAGTALIGLESLSRTHDEFDRELILSKSCEIALDDSAANSSRMTALRLTAQVGMDQGSERMVSTADTARMLAQTGETDLLRSAAIVTLGEVGAPDDRELLDSYLLDDNRQIADAAKMALVKMDARW